MADRGDCSFVTKARSAQLLGASALIIADVKCLCGDEECEANQLDQGGDTSCQKNMPIMADDGSASDISIPTVLMGTMDANRIKGALVRNEPVYMELSWPVDPVTPGSKVGYELWTTPFDFNAHDFQMSWRDIVVKFEDKTVFTPHLFIYDGIVGGCRNATDPNNPRNSCHSMCTNVGRYCAVDPDGDLDNGISGKDVIVESLRRLCIWEHYGKDGVGLEYWDYVQGYLQTCENSYFFGNPNCIDSAFKYAGIEQSEIKQCMTDTGGLKSPSVNALLEKQIDASKSRGIVMLPTKFVNDMPIRGSLTSSNVFNALCASFGDDTNKPQICLKCQNCPDLDTCAQEGECYPTVDMNRPDDFDSDGPVSEEELFWTEKRCNMEVSAMERCMVGVNVDILSSDSCLSTATQCQTQGSLLFQPYELLNQAMPLPDECEGFYKDDYSVTILLNKVDDFNSKCKSFPIAPSTSKFSTEDGTVNRKASSNFLMFLIGALVTGILVALYKRTQMKKDETYSEVVKKESHEKVEQHIMRQDSEVV